MKAYRLHGIDDLRLEEVPDPAPKAGEVVVKIKAAGICGSDIPRIYRTGTYSFPTIPGHEFVGEVSRLGEGVGPEWLGRRVGVFPLLPCKECFPCKNKQYELCRHYGYLGSRDDGAFAEYAAVPVWNLIELPENVPYGTAAMLEPMAVAVHAMRRIWPEGKPRQGWGGEEGRHPAAVVCGLGTIGLLLAMFLREAGAGKLLVVGNKDYQKQMAEKTGISEECYLDSRSRDIREWVLEQTDGIGADVFFECVGRNETISAAVDSTAPGGKVMLVGNPASDVVLDKAVYWKILRHQMTLLGSWNSSFTHETADDWHYVLERLAGGCVHPEQYITRVFPFEELETGLRIMRDKSEEHVKYIVSNESI